jgi:hypothetical protein
LTIKLQFVAEKITHRSSELINDFNDTYFKGNLGFKGARHA